jgi:hypothetical protein
MRKMKYGNILQTGQDHCYDSKGQLTPCQGSGQDGEYRLGATWQEALDQIVLWNQKSFLGFNDWRLPNRTELRSLMSYQARNPSLPSGQPFTHIFLGWYWTSTTVAINPAYAWYVHLEGARMFYGRKDQYYPFWPVHG